MILTICHTKPLCSKFWKIENVHWLRPFNESRQNEIINLQVRQIYFTTRSNNKLMLGVPMKKITFSLFLMILQTLSSPEKINCFFTMFDLSSSPQVAFGKPGDGNRRRFKVKSAVPSTLPISCWGPGLGPGEVPLLLQHKSNSRTQTLSISACLTFFLCNCRNSAQIIKLHVCCRKIQVFYVSIFGTTDTIKSYQIF